jgi:hypothetical protein
MRRHFRVFLAFYLACVGFCLLHLPGNLIGHARSKEGDGKELKVTNIEKLNTSADEDDPCLAPTGLAFYFTQKSKGGGEIMVATRKAKDQPLANPKSIEELNGSDTTSPFPMPREADGSEYIFFATKGEANNFDIYFTRRLRPTEPFQRIAKAPVHQVCTPEDEAHPCVSPDSKEMYFSRKTKDGWRVGHATGAVPRSFEKVELLDFEPGFCHATVTKDGTLMILQGPVEESKLGLFVCKRGSKSAPWGKPQPIAALNAKDSTKGDCSPSLSPDGTFLYFASDRPGGKGGLDLYYVPMSELKKAGL